MTSETLRALGNLIPYVSEVYRWGFIDVEHLEFVYSREEMTENEEVLFSLLIKCVQSFNEQKEKGFT